MTFVTQPLKNKPDTFFAPITFLSVLTLSVAVMAFLFFYQPLQLFIEGGKKEAVNLFVKTIGIFAVFTSPVIITTFLMLFVKDYMNNKIEMAVLYDKLKKSVSPGNGTDDRPSITESSEEKLKRVIAFIEENFTSDISREGLAAAVDLNPSYMSRLFMTYTGKKISEYINELRVKQVVEKIENGGNLILDIALDAGFESMSTFNRAFKKITGTTPSEYKKTK